MILWDVMLIESAVFAVQKRVIFGRKNHVNLIIRSSLFMQIDRAKEERKFRMNLYGYLFQQGSFLLSESKHLNVLTEKVSAKYIKEIACSDMRSHYFHAEKTLIG